MKKTLIALAVLAASGASFAQVTITGNLAMGFRSTTTGAVAGASGDTTAAGFGVDTSEIDFAATEDLGGGMKITAKLALAGADRSGEGSSALNVKAGTMNGRDASLALQTSVGVFTLASASSADYLSGGVAGVGAYYQGFDGKVLSARSNRDTATYTLPMGAVTLGVSYQEGANNQGLGGGTAGAIATTQQPLTAYVVNYAQGALVVNGNYLSYNSRIENSQVATNGGVKDVYRLSGSYDFGAAKLGLGAQVGNYNTPKKITDVLLGLSVPVGAVTFGGQWVNRNTADSTTLTENGGQTGAEIQMTYAMSKRTSFIAGYAQWAAAVGSANSSEYNLLLSHSF